MGKDITVYLKDEYSESWLPEYKHLSHKTKIWLSEKAICAACNLKIPPSTPCCNCIELKSVIIRGKVEVEFWDIYSYERKRENNRYASEYYRKIKGDADGHYTKNDVLKIFEIQCGRCYYCLKEISYTGSRKNFHVEHMTPLSKGGSNWPENIACACVECNQLKSNRGANAFWNLLKKKHGEGRVKEAKEIAERQKLAKAEISQRRKLKEKLKVKS